MNEENKYRNFSDRGLVEEYIFKYRPFTNEEELLIKELKRRNLFNYAQLLYEHFYAEFNKIWKDGINGRK